MRGMRDYRREPRSQPKKEVGFARHLHRSLMDKPAILHILSPLQHVSPFDITMAYDAGFDAVVPYASVTLEQIPGLVQDVIFPRSPKDLKRSAILVGGRDAGISMDMVDSAKDA